MQATNSRMSRRQPAIRLLAQEFGESSLNEKGPGEFDPAFVITKLGARVNRLLVAGLLDSLEPLETSSGTMWRGQLKDASGIHYFTVGRFDSDTIQAQVETLASLHESGDPLLLMMVAKGRCYTTEEGAVYTSMRPEEIAIIDRQRYATWLVQASQETMKRVADHDAAAALAPSRQAYAEAGIPAHSIEGLLKSREFYGETDTEVHRLMVMRALDIAEGKREVAENTWSSTTSVPENDTTETKENTTEAEIGDVLTSIIEQLDEGKGVDLENVLSSAAARGFDRQTSETKLDQLVDEGSLKEPRFGWFSLS
jgi:RPA family protein